jgi:hypothetical protein
MAIAIGRMEALSDQAWANSMYFVGKLGSCLVQHFARDENTDGASVATAQLLPSTGCATRDSVWTRNLVSYSKRDDWKYLRTIPVEKIWKLLYECKKIHGWKYRYVYSSVLLARVSTLSGLHWL